MKAYQDALYASRARWDTVGRGTGRLSVRLADEVSRQAFLSELKKRGLDAQFVDTEGNAPVRFPPRTSCADLKSTLTVGRSWRGYTMTLTVKNTGKTVQDFWFHSCGPYTTEGNSVGQLKSGESHTRTLHWDGQNSVGQPVAAGQYKAKVALGDVVGETVFEVR